MTAEPKICSEQIELWFSVRHLLFRFVSYLEILVVAFFRSDLQHADETKTVETTQSNRALANIPILWFTVNYPVNFLNKYNILSHIAKENDSIYSAGIIKWQIGLMFSSLPTENSKIQNEWMFEESLLACLQSFKHLKYTNI